MSQKAAIGINILIDCEKNGKKGTGRRMSLTFIVHISNSHSLSSLPFRKECAFLLLVGTPHGPRKSGEKLCALNHDPLLRVVEHSKSRLKSQHQYTELASQRERKKRRTMSYGLLDPMSRHWTVHARDPMSRIRKGMEAP